METIKLTTAQALVKFLDNQYIEFDGKENKFIHGIFTIFGHGNVVGLGEALLETDNDLLMHQGRNEQGMAHAAMGFAKQKLRKEIYAVSSSVGPGAANMVTAAATATANRIPVLFLPGDTYASRQPDPVLQQIEQFNNLNITTNDAFKAVTKYWDRINRPEQLMSSLINALRVLTDPANTGAVCIGLPQDVQGESYDYPTSFFKKRVHRIERIPPSEAMIEDAINLITSKKKPIIICGGGVKYSEAQDTLKDFCEKFNIPFGETQSGKSCIVSNHNLNLGGIGTTGTLSANIIAKDADLVIGIGTRFSDFTTASKWLFRNNEVDFLSINVASFDAYKLDSTKVIGDAKVSLELLKEKLEKANYKSTYKDEIKDAKDKWNKEMKRLSKVEYCDDFKPEINDNSGVNISDYIKTNDSCLTQTSVLSFINDFIDDDSIAVGAAGSLPGDMQRMWLSNNFNTYHMEYAYSCMGYEVGAALGAKIANESAEVYTLLGDGSFMMLHSELATSIQENKKINLLLFDNMEFGCINNLQAERGMKSFGTEMRSRNKVTNLLDGPLVKVDFAKIAEGYGCKAYTVKNFKELEEALIDAKKQTKSILIDIKILPKTMTHGYDAFWRCGTAEISNNKDVISSTKEQEEELKKARKY